MADNSLIALADGIIFTGDAFIEGHALLIRDGRVLDIVTMRNVPGSALAKDCGGAILAPGFVDCQVNGGGGYLLNNTPNAATAVAIAEAHARYGTTRSLPTCITDTPEVMTAAVEAVTAARRVCPHILGIHLEGPHLSAERRGVHRAADLRDMADTDVSCYKPHEGGALLMTVAPERVRPEQIAALRKQGVIVSLGHTGAAPEAIRAAIGAGATGFTHLFNGMGGLNAREPGPAGIALDEENAWCGLIADGYHVDPAMIRLAVRAKPDRIFLVSDAMPPAASAMPQGFELYGETIEFAGSRCNRVDGTFAGTAITLGDAVRYCIETVKIEPAAALRMASAHPAEFLGLGDRYGKLLPGFAADVVALNTTFHVTAAWCGGVAIHRTGQQ